MKSTRYFMFCVAAFWSIFSFASSAFASDTFKYEVIAQSGQTDFYGREIVGIVGDPSDTTNRSSISVNDNGYVAFVGRVRVVTDQRTFIAQNVYVYHPDFGAPYPLVPTVFELPESGDAPTQLFSGVQINNLNQVQAWRRTNTVVFIGVILVGLPIGQTLTAPFTYLEIWDGTAPRTQLPSLVAMGDAGIGLAWVFMTFLNPVTGGVYPSPFVPLSPWDAIHSPRNGGFPSINNNGDSVFVGLDGGKNYLATPTFAPYFYDYIETEGEPRRARISDDISIGRDVGIVVQLTNNDVKEVVLLQYNLKADNIGYGVIAGPSNGFTNVGQSPTISDDGKIVVFYGELSEEGAEQMNRDRPEPLKITPGPGIFAAVWTTSYGGIIRTWTIHRIAGRHDNDKLDTGEVFEDTNRNGHLDPGEVDEGAFLGFYADERFCVNNAGTVLYFAKNLQDNKAIFRSCVNPESETYPVSDPTQVVQEGDTIEGLGPVDSISMYDSLNNRGRPGDMVFWVSSGSTQAIVKAKIEVEPLVFVAGAAASDLRETDGLFEFFIWPTVQRAKIKALTLEPGQTHLNIIATDVTRSFSPGFGLFETIVYKELLDMLVNRACYREYMVSDNPTKRTLQGWDKSQIDNNPSLFVFAYDWRKSNADNVAALREYIAVIHQFYPDTKPKVNIIAHSMGGLLSRRYILDNPGNHFVNKMITIGSPWLGAPKAIMALEEGTFYLNWMDTYFGGIIKEVIEFFPGLHELLPAQGYITLGGQPYEERGYDINGNGVYYETYDYDALVDILDKRFRPDINGRRPGTNGKIFHTNAQDDWSSDSSGVKYLHIVGCQSIKQTVGSVIVEKPVGIGRIIQFEEGKRVELFPKVHFNPVMDWGDKTVPVLSAKRQSYAGDLNAPGALVHVLVGSPVGKKDDPDFHKRYSDEYIEHTNLCSNFRSHDAILSFLRTGQVPQDDKRLENFKMEPSLYISVLGVDYISVTDSFGNTNTRINDEFALKVPSVEYLKNGSQSVHISAPANQTYTLTLHAGNEPINFDLLRGGNNKTPTEATRYKDLNLPVGAMVMLTVNPNGTTLLRYDSDGDGSLDKTIDPTIFVSGPAAADVEPPIVTITEDCQSNDHVVTIVATDSGAGLQDLYYSLDGRTAQPYSGQIRVDPLRMSIIYAFATDKIGNRSSLIAYRLDREPLDMTSQVRVTRGGFRYNRATQRYVQQITLTNTGGKAVPCPVSLVLDSLSSNAELFNSAGFTTKAPPLNSPYINVNVGSDNTLTPGESATVVLEFTNPSNRSITYNTRVLAGPGLR